MDSAVPITPAALSQSNLRGGDAATDFERLYPRDT